jgi:addiction module RelB/DinJ family antitoxin
MRKTIQFDIDETIAAEAEAIYNSLGMDTEMALGMFMRRTVLQGGMPFDVSQAATRPARPVSQPVENKAADPIQEPAPSRQVGKISESMAARVWEEFVSWDPGTEGTSDVADRIAAETGMNGGSAFIYLNMLSNLVQGKPNTRNMKMKDLEYYMSRIGSELGNDAYQHAIESLRASVGYWNKPEFGNFAQKVEDYIRVASGQAPVHAESRRPVSHGANDPYPTMKVGEIAKNVLRPMIANGAATDEEIDLMQQAEYSKSVFDLNYPLLARAESFDRSRYYVTPFEVRGIRYVLCSQWFESSINNDRPYLLRWIAEHSQERQH